MVMTPDWEPVGCEFKYNTGIFSFLKEKPSLISLILNTKSEKHECHSKPGDTKIKLQEFFYFYLL